MGRSSRVRVSDRELRCRVLYGANDVILSRLRNIRVRRRQAGDASGLGSLIHRLDDLEAPFCGGSAAGGRLDSPVAVRNLEGKRARPGSWVFNRLVNPG